MTIVGIVGSRYFNNYDHFKLCIAHWMKAYGPITNIVSGGATGADSLAYRYALENGMKDAIIHKPEYEKYDDAATRIRNQLIVDDSQHLIAFTASSSVGTYITINMARKKGIPVTIFQV